MKAAPIRAEFIIDRQGKSFCLFAGLVDAAHRSGLRAIRTQLEQAPSEANQWTAIVSAVSTFIDDAGVEYTFSGIGDANAINVGRMIAPHIIRMADTRAVARSLRLALNVGVAAVEELGDEAEETPAGSPPTGLRPVERGSPALRQQQPRVLQPQRPQVAQPASTLQADDLPASCQPASSAQLTSLAKLQVALGRPAVVPDGLTSEQAAAQIRELVQVFNESQKSSRR